MNSLNFDKEFVLVCFFCAMLRPIFIAYTRIPEERCIWLMKDEN